MPQPGGPPDDAWPGLIEELRILVGPMGRPVPQALLEVGLRGPAPLRPAFLAAQREWVLSTDFERMVAVLKDRLADPTADATCETLLVVQEVGGELDRRLADLADDRRADLRDRREGDAKQAGARVARWFVVLVPAGMALAGLSVGDGRAAYRTATGQVLAGAGIALVVTCGDDQRDLPLSIPRGFDPKKPALIVLYFHGNLATLARDCATASKCRAKWRSPA